MEQRKSGKDWVDRSGKMGPSAKSVATTMSGICCSNLQILLPKNNENRVYGILKLHLFEIQMLQINERHNWL